jgi:hypothetical protein
MSCNVSSTMLAVGTIKNHGAVAMSNVQTRTRERGLLTKRFPDLVFEVPAASASVDDRSALYTHLCTG